MRKNEVKRLVQIPNLSKGPESGAAWPLSEGPRDLRLVAQRVFMKIPILCARDKMII